ncbi:MAG: 5-(carboxyamino)imidazole ribonucleotide mutase, partial [Planctomycetes bacterium]|nr:5-(carboxyamino)imidazole ribonucleotide mutase [Planctomycetota bacterium]
RLGVGYRVRVLSAHRSPEALREFVGEAPRQGVRVFIALAGGAAHLAGVIAAQTELPVIGVPVDSSPLKGVDALHATVMMPGGVPVATMAVGRAGAENAGVFAAQVMALSDPGLAGRVRAYRRELAAGVSRKDAAVQERLAQRRR